MLNLSKIPYRYIKILSTVVGIGYIPKAPGTYGSLAGLLCHIFGRNSFSTIWYYALLAAGLYLSVLICGEAEKRMHKKDPACVVLDEFMVMPLCFLGLSIEECLWIWVLGFIVFRVFDIFKPLGIAKLQNLKGGWGVVMDDVAAAFATNIVLQGVIVLGKF